MLDATAPLDPAMVRCAQAPAGPWEHLTPAEERWLDGEVEQLAAEPSTAPGADASAQLSLPGVAGVVAAVHGAGAPAHPCAGLLVSRPGLLSSCLPALPAPPLPQTLR